MDELGLAIQHSENPNSITYPFLFSKNNIMDENIVAYNLLFINESVDPQTIIMRDYLNGIKEE